VTVTGDGIGGRNTEFALAAALELAERGDSAWLIASLATDGQDGLTDAAGAIGSASTIERCVNAGCDPVAALAANDSLRVFDIAGGTVRPGPTGTNVNDLFVGLRFGD
jgi:hydroxypyruvate reductase